MKNMDQEQSADGLVFERQMPGVDHAIGDLRNHVGSNRARLEVFKITAAAAKFDDDPAGRDCTGILEQSPVPIVVAALKQRTLKNQGSLDREKLGRAGLESVEGFFLEPGKH